MTYRGKVKNGVVVLSRRASLPEGTTVMVRPLPGKGAARKRRSRVPTLYEGLKPFIGMAKGLPPDASLNVDHYLYGAPKRK
jgi:hypothetical protein